MKPLRTAELVRHCRTARKLSQTDLAKVIKTSPQYISNFERGIAVINLSKLKKLIRKIKADPMAVKHALIEDYEYKISKYF